MADMNGIAVGWKLDYEDFTLEDLFVVNATDKIACVCDADNKIIIVEEDV